MEQCVEKLSNFKTLHNELDESSISNPSSITCKKNENFNLQSSETRPLLYLPLHLRQFTLTHTRRSTKVLDYSYPYEYDFDLEKGTERLKYIMINTLTQPRVTTPTFYGYCYFCDCPKHSQNYCPLKYCHFCESYGHSTRVCPKKSARYNSDWRHKGSGIAVNGFNRQNVFHHFRYWRRQVPTFRTSQKIKIPFGSTWKTTSSLSRNSDWRIRPNKCVTPTPTFVSAPDLDIEHTSCVSCGSCGSGNTNTTAATTTTLPCGVFVDFD
jgi:hypothetical protein